MEMCVPARSGLRDWHEMQHLASEGQKQKPGESDHDEIESMGE